MIIYVIILKNILGGVNVIIDALVCEIGSTTTIVNAFTDFHLDEPKYLGQAFAPTTIKEGDVSLGVRQAIEKLKETLGVSELKYKEMFATSSAAGGLKMTVHGLVYDMTANAAYEAATGAGGNISLVTSGDLRKTDLQKIVNANPNIILVAGGVDFGERNTALNNIEKILNLDLSVPIIYAGNIENHEEISLIFEEFNKKDLLIITENVYPKIDSLNIEPVRKIIHDTFENHITKAKGMEKIKTIVTENIMPTPGAVMESAKLLYEEIGDLICYDIGGATTDIHSVTEGTDEIKEILTAPVPKAKRTVEGDLGVYVNRINVAKNISEEIIEKEHNTSFESFTNAVSNLVPIPTKDEEFKLIETLSKICLKVALERHAGNHRDLYTTYGKKQQAEGKDLTAVKYIIGTGGPLTKLKNNRELLKSIHTENKKNKLYPPKEARILIDNNYIMASCGVLSKKHPETALKLLKKSLEII